MLDELSKKEAPIVARWRRKILKQSGLNAAKRNKLKPSKEEEKDTFQAEAVTSFETPLAKNEYEVSQFDNGDVKMEFGPEVPAQFRKRAMEWAKKRGLKSKETSLGKSETSNTWVIFSKA